MIERLRIAVADDDDEMCSYYQRVLPAVGHQVIATCEDGQSLVTACRGERPDLIVCDIDMPRLDGIAAVAEICDEAPLPVVLVTAHNDDTLLERAAREYILAYLIKPIKRTDLETAILLVMQRFREFQLLLQDTSDPRRALDDRKIIEQAKGILTKHAMLDEPAAYRRLQQIARDENLPLVAIARQIVTTNKPFR